MAELVQEKNKSTLMVYRTSKLEVFQLRVDDMVSQYSG